MQRFLTAAAVLVLASIISVQSNAQEKKDNTPPEGFVPLFNGKDLNGWKGLPKPKGKTGPDNPFVRATLSPEELKKVQAEADDNMRAHWRVEDGALVFD